MNAPRIICEVRSPIFGAHMQHDFDAIYQRTGTDSVKWNLYPADVLPLWIAEADFRPPEAVVQALADRVAQGIFGYTAAAGHASAPGAAWEYPEIAQVIVARLAARYNWHIRPEDIVYLPGVVAGFNVACKIAGDIGDEVVMHAPCYGPIQKGPANQGRVGTYAMLREGTDAQGLRTYNHDHDALQSAITQKSRMFLLCNPHNPTGRMFTHAELDDIAQSCLANNMLICSDEIHAELVLSDQQHIPIASISEQVAQQTITLYSPSKTFNIPGLGFCVAIIQNPVLRAKFLTAMQGLVASPQIFGYTGAMAAFRYGDAWLHDLLVYLKQNQAFVLSYMRTHMPQLIPNRAEGTYLAWIDCRQADLPGVPSDFFLREAKVALGNGGAFGPAGEGYVRLTMATQRETLQRALDAMRVALQNYS